MKALLDREPVMTMAVVQTALAAGVAFGAHLSADQVAALMAVTAAVLGWLSRSKVTPA